MPTQRLKALAAELHEELEKTPSLDDEGARVLQGMRTEIADLIDASREQRDATGLLGRLRGSVERFEHSHPDLTAVIERIADALSSAGI